GIKELRDKIKQTAKKIENPTDIKTQKITVGILGYPNTGKSSLINLLIGKKSAGTGAEAGFTKGLQKIKLTPDIVLIDSPGVIPESKYSSSKKEAIAQHTKLGGRSYSQVKNPELSVARIMKEYPGILESFYNLKLRSKRNVEELIEKLGRKKGFLKKGNKVNEDKTARFILKNWQEGKIKP
ncbi:MAG: GTPase, partial [Candidatus Nanoarchaeia archaeon]